jgi:hypothetical protein
VRPAAANNPAMDQAAYQVPASVRSCPVDRLLAQAARDHQAQPRPEGVPFLLPATRLASVEVGRAVLGTVLPGVQGGLDPL